MLKILVMIIAAAIFAYFAYNEFEAAFGFMS